MCSEVIEMAPLLLRGMGDNRRQRGRSSAMYAISFDLDTKVLQQSYPSPSWLNAYSDIEMDLQFTSAGPSRKRK